MMELFTRCESCERKRQQLEAMSYVYRDCTTCHGVGFVPIAQDAVVIERGRWTIVADAAASWADECDVWADERARSIRRAITGNGSKSPEGK